MRPCAELSLNAEQSYLFILIFFLTLGVSSKLIFWKVCLWMVAWSTSCIGWLYCSCVHAVL